RQVVAFVSDPDQAVEILAKLGLPTKPPPLTRARAPPCQEEMFDQAPATFAADPTYPDT
ncbi:MAG: hypothetical protein HY901_08580, partial [Deltaproteobacteria bacterium]|nr:hypothetical protein [Deltaproteobacteria bacterium]